MARETVVLLIYHGHGHFNACFGIGKILQERYHVIFAGYAYFQKHVEQQGFHFYRLTSLPFGLGFESWVSKLGNSKFHWWSALQSRITDKLYYARHKELSLLIEKTNPAYFLIDSWQSTDFIVVYNLLAGRNTKVGFIQTMLPTVVNSARAPLNADIDFQNENEVQQASKQFLAHKKLKEIRDRFRFLGFDNNKIIKRRLETNRIPSKYHPREQSLFSMSFQNVQEFILAPEEFEFPDNKVSNNHRYIGSQLDPGRKEYSSQNFNEIFSAIRDKKRALKLVYCSIGTTDHEQPELLDNFINYVVQAAEQDNWLCIISTGSQKFKVENHTGNIYFFEQVPQLTVLQSADVFITHGGLNSIKESIHLEVPMLVYPIRTDSDQQGNAARVAYHELGLKGDIREDTPEEIKQKVKRLMTDDSFRANLGKFKNIELKYSAENFLKLLEGLKPLD